MDWRDWIWLPVQNRKCGG